MSEFEVIKPFNTVNRRFAPGSGPGGTVTESDDLSPLTIDGLIERKFIKAKAVEVVAEATSAPVSMPPAKTSASRPALAEADDK